MNRRGRFFLHSIYKTDDLDDAMMFQHEKDHAYIEGYHAAYLEILKQLRDYKGNYFVPTMVEPRSRYKRYLKYLEKVWRKEKWTWV